MSIYENHFYYQYDELVKNYLENRNQENRNALGEWYETYGTKYWNGEKYDISDIYKMPSGFAGLKPIYKGVGEPDEDGDYPYYDIIGYEEI